MGKFCPIIQSNTVYLSCRECEEMLCKKEYLALLIAGTRTYNDFREFSAICDRVTQNYKDVIIISGGAKGADCLAEYYAKQKRYPFIEVKAEWDRYGKRAGYIRNRKMHEMLSQNKNRGVLLFWDGKSRGTAQNIDLAKEFGTDIRIWNFEEKKFIKQT